jgi:hypothetical protein
MLWSLQMIVRTTEAAEQLLASVEEKDTMQTLFES